MRMAIEHRLQKKYPGLWSLLNKNAQKNLPYGINEYLNKKNYKRKSWQALQIPENYINDLINFCGVKIVGDTYRPDLSAVHSESSFLDILHEIVLCASLARIGRNIKLRPRAGERTRCDVLFQVEGIDVFGEVKHWVDNWSIDPGKPKSRLLFKSSANEINQNHSKPRSMELYGKLMDATRQFPAGNVNILFVFAPSIGDSLTYLQQALWGDFNFFKKSDKIVLENDGLFATPEGNIISACYLSHIDFLDFGKLVFTKAGNNPNATVPLPASVENFLKKYDAANLNQ